ncbi:MAG: shikimate kinase [Terriglobales bacterium]
MTTAHTYILTGFMGAGKSSIGLALSRKANLPFVELDERIEVREGRTIARIFREAGEDAFREIEHRVLRELLTTPASTSRILALGGGAFMHPSILQLIQEKTCTTVFLDAPPDELFHRCAQQPGERPLCQNLNDFRNLYEARRERYLAATLRVDTGGKDIETVAAEVACSLGLGKG